MSDFCYNIPVRRHRRHPTWPAWPNQIPRSPYEDPAHCPDNVHYPKSAVLPDAKEFGCRKCSTNSYAEPPSLPALHREALVIEKRKLTSEIEKLERVNNVLRITISRLELELEVLRAKHHAQECDAFGFQIVCSRM